MNAPMPKKIVISYRRVDSPGMVGRIYDRLIGHYGRDSVFLDIDDIAAGVDFRERINDALNECEALIAVIGPNWLGPREQGQSRIHDDNDPIRIEIEVALQRNILILPVLLDSVGMPNEAHLPTNLKKFSYLNATRIDSGKDFDHHVNRLIRSLDNNLATITPQPQRVEIIVGRGQPFEVLEPSGTNLVSRVRVKIENRTGRYISSGIVHIVDLDPPNMGHSTFLLKNDLTVPNHSDTIVEVAAFNVGTGDARPGQWIRLLIPVTGSYHGAGLVGNLPVQPHTFQIKFSSIDGLSFGELPCRLSVDDGNLLRLEQWEDRPKSTVGEQSRFGPNISAREAFFQILGNSEWAREQVRTTTNTETLVYDWLEVRLSTEIHNALRNSRLDSWGEECLAGTATTPQKPVPPATRDSIKIDFDRTAQFPRTGAFFRGRTSREIGRMVWVDIQFSKQQVFSLFPMSSQKWRPMFEAVSHVARSIGDIDKKTRWPKARRLLRQSALEKKILIRGNKSASVMNGSRWSEVETDIPNTYWETADITELATDGETDALLSHTFPHRFSDGHFGDEIFLYAKLRVKWDDIMKEWPC